MGDKMDGGTDAGPTSVSSPPRAVGTRKSCPDVPATDAEVEPLFSAMRERAEAERAAVLEEADSKVRDIHARAETEAERIHAEALRRVDGEVRAESDRILGRARMDRRNRLVAVKRKLCRQAFERAGSEIQALCGSAEYRRILEGLIEEALSAVGASGSARDNPLHGDATEDASGGPAGRNQEERSGRPGKGACVEVVASDLAICEAVTGRLGGSSSARAFGDPPGAAGDQPPSLVPTGLRGAVVATSDDGLRRVDNSLATRLARAEMLLTHEIAGILFASGRGRESASAPEVIS